MTAPVAAGSARFLPVHAAWSMHANRCSHPIPAPTPPPSKHRHEKVLIQILRHLGPTPASSLCMFLAFQQLAAARNMRCCSPPSTMFVPWSQCRHSSPSVCIFFDHIHNLARVYLPCIDRAAHFPPVNKPHTSPWSRTTGFAFPS